MIDRHNRCRQDDLKVEKKIEVKEFSFRFSSSLLAIVIVGAWNICKSSNGLTQLKIPSTFYCDLTEVLVANTCDRINSTARSAEQLEETEDQLQPEGACIH